MATTRPDFRTADPRSADFRTADFPELLWGGPRVRHLPPLQEGNKNKNNSGRGPARREPARPGNRGASGGVVGSGAARLRRLVLPASNKQYTPNLSILWHLPRNTARMGKRGAATHEPLAPVLPAGDMIRFSHGAAASVGRVPRSTRTATLRFRPFSCRGRNGRARCGRPGEPDRDRGDRRLRRARPLPAEAVLTALEHANRHIIERDPANRMGTTATGLAALETAGGDHLMSSTLVTCVSTGWPAAALSSSPWTTGSTGTGTRRAITREQARTHPRRNVVTRALGSDSVGFLTTGCCPLSAATGTSSARRPVQRAAR